MYSSQTGKRAKHINYTVRPGDCIESIAYEHGMLPQTIWQDSQNKEVRRKRKKSNLLLAGDKLFIPERRLIERSAKTERKHRYRRKAVPSKLHLVFEDENGPLVEKLYTMDIDGIVVHGITNYKGEVKHSIVPNAKFCKIRLGKEPDVIEYKIQLGHMDPINETNGVRLRLENLGYPCAVSSSREDIDSQLQAALTAFQEKMGLDVTGKIDQATMDALENEHGS